MEHRFRESGNEKMKQQKFSAALVDFTMGLQINSDSAALLSNRAAAYTCLDSIDEAIVDLVRATEIDPKFIAAHVRLGFAYLYQGNAIASLKSYSEAVRLSLSVSAEPLEEFMVRLKHSLHLASRRAKQQGYPPEDIDRVFTSETREMLERYDTSTVFPPQPSASGFANIAFIPLAATSINHQGQPPVGNPAQSPHQGPQRQQTQPPVDNPAQSQPQRQQTQSVQNQQNHPNPPIFNNTQEPTFTSEITFMTSDDPNRPRVVNQSGGFQDIVNVFNNLGNLQQHRQSGQSNNDDPEILPPSVEHPNHGNNSAISSAMQFVSTSLPDMFRGFQRAHHNANNRQRGSNQNAGRGDPHLHHDQDHSSDVDLD